MQNALYIFLKRRWEQDESYLNTVLSYFVDSSDCLQLLLFPEGTNFEDASKVKSDSFARKNNLPSYDFVLHPRVRGFTYCVEKLRQGRLDAVHDVTIGYSENYCFEEIDLLKGNVPDEIHFIFNATLMKSFLKTPKVLKNGAVNDGNKRKKD